MSNQKFKDLFIPQIQDNNTRCGDRAAMGLNEIYAAWRITCPKEDTLLKAKLQTILGVAKTGILRTTLATLIQQHARSVAPIRESVEIYLYYESTLRHKLGLITAVQSMIYTVVGKQDWIEEQYLKEQVEQHYLDEAVKTDFFNELFQEDESAKKDLDKIRETSGLQMEALEKQKKKQSMGEDDYKKKLDLLKEQFIASENELKKEWVRTIFNQSMGVQTRSKRRKIS